MTRSHAVLMALAVSITLALNLVSLQTYPPPSCDETDYGGSAVSWLIRGTFGWPAYSQGEYLGRDVDVPRMGRAYAIGMAGAFRAFGISIPVGRLYSVAGWLIAGFMTWLVGRTLGYRQAGVWAALAFLSSPRSLLSSHLMRPEAWLVAAHLVALWAVLLATRSERVGLAFPAGLVSVVPTEYHGHGFALLAGLVTAFCWQGRHRPRAVGLYLVGVASGLLLWVGWRYLDSGGAVRAQLHEALGFTALGKSPDTPVALGLGLLGNLLTLPTFLRTAYVSAGPAALIEATLGLVGLATALRRRPDGRLLVATHVLVSFGVFSLLFSLRFVQYAITWTPLLYLAGFIAIGELVTVRRAAIARSWLATAGLSILLVNWVGMAWLAVRYREVDFPAMSARLRALVPASSRVMGDPAWWWTFREDHVFITDEYLGTPLPGEGPDKGDARGRVQAYLSRLRPRYVILDGAIGCRDRGGPGFDELERHVHEHCRRVGEVLGPWVGRGREHEGFMGQRTTVFRCE